MREKYREAHIPPCLHHMQPIDRHQIFEQEDPAEETEKGRRQQQMGGPLIKLATNLYFLLYYI